MTKITTLVWLLLVATYALAQEQKIAEQPKLDVSKMHDALPDKDYTARTADTSFVAPDGERVQRLEIVVPGVTPKQVWEAVSTSEGLRSFVAPVTEVEMKTGGHYYTNYNPAARIGDPGTIYNTVLAYIPLEMVAIHVKLGRRSFPPPWPMPISYRRSCRSRTWATAACAFPRS